MKVNLSGSTAQLLDYRGKVSRIFKLISSTGAQAAGDRRLICGPELRHEGVSLIPVTATHKVQLLLNSIQRRKETKLCQKET